MRGPVAGLTEAYEQMRQQQRGAGYELVRRWGLVGWMDRAAPYLPLAPSPSPPARSPSTLHPQGDGAGEGLPESLYPALTQLLAGVAMSWLREEQSQ
jgi:hypothetical protein